MLVSDIFTVFLIPSIVSSENGTKATTGLGSVEDFEGNWTDFSNIFKRPELPTGEQRQTPPPRGVDPLLDAVNEDVRRLGLEYADDYFDHLEDNSEEVRELIRRRQQSLDSKTTTTSQAPTSTPGTNSHPTEFPILNPSTDNAPTTKKPSVIGSAISGIKTEAGSVFGKISNVGRSLFGRGTTTTTTTTPSPPKPEQLQVEGEAPTKNCTQVFQIFFKGDCRNLLQKQFCPSPTQWLVEDPVTLRPTCVENPCHSIHNTASFGGKCTVVGEEKECHTGMKTFIYRSGIVECDCKPGYLFNQEDGICYEAYKRGPCSLNQHFKLSKGAPACMPNPCLKEDYFCNAPRCVKQRNCDRIEPKCENTGTVQYVLNPTTFTPTACNSADLELPTKIIGNVPTLSCAPGSRRDILGNCRTPTVIDFS